MIFPQCDPPIQHTNNEQKAEVHKTTIEIGTEEKEDLIVTATPAIVTEDQLDSISFYDDVGTLKPSYLGLGGGDLYESIAGSILNLAKRNSSMEDMYSSVLYASKNEGESIDNVSFLRRHLAAILVDLITKCSVIFISREARIYWRSLK